MVGDSPGRFRGLRCVDIGRHTVPVAESLASRLLGLALLDRDRAGPGLMIPRCRSVHTFGMRFALDMLFLDGALQVIAIRQAVPSGRVLIHRGAAAILELPSQRV